MDTIEEQDCLFWLRNHYIPTALTSGDLHSPLLTKIVSSPTEGVNYSLQFHVENMNLLQKWYSKTGEVLSVELNKKFGERVVGFSTLLEKVEI